MWYHFQSLPLMLALLFSYSQNEHKTYVFIAVYTKNHQHFPLTNTKERERMRSIFMVNRETQSELITQVCKFYTEFRYWKCRSVVWFVGLSGYFHFNSSIFFSNVMSTDLCKSVSCIPRNSQMLKSFSLSPPLSLSSKNVHEYACVFVCVYEILYIVYACMNI